MISKQKAKTILRLVKQAPRYYIVETPKRYQKDKYYGKHKYCLWCPETHRPVCKVWQEAFNWLLLKGFLEARLASALNPKGYIISQMELSL